MLLRSFKLPGSLVFNVVLITDARFIGIPY